MIKLKIGDNYLITTYEDKAIKDYIIYMMGCFTKHNKVALGINFSPDYHHGQYTKMIREENLTTVYLLIYDIYRDNLTKKPTMLQHIMSQYVRMYQQECPNVKFYVINIDKYKNTREFKLAKQVYETLESDKNSLVSRLNKLDSYKNFSTRFKSIPDEIRVINDNIKQMAQEKKVTENVCSLDSLAYLNLIDKAHLEGSHLILDLKPTYILPSEPLGKCMTLSSFEHNPYLVKAAKYLYQGYKFGMVPTRVAIRSNFTPEFIETLDHRFDDIFAKHNWSNIGYPHFGINHFCGGELNDVIAHTAEHGLEYFFICFKQYITTANMRDYAGRKVWWYPIYDDEGKIVYCAGLDILRDNILNQDIPESEKERIKNMSWEEFLQWRENHDVYFFNTSVRNVPNDGDSYSGKDDMFIEYCKTHDPELYEKLKEGVRL